MSVHVPATFRSNGLQRDLIRLGVLPCAGAALALTLWFTHERLATLEEAFSSEGNAVARQLAVVSDLSLYAGDDATLRDIAHNTVAKGLAKRVEISNSAGIYVSAGPSIDTLEHARLFGAPVRLRAARSLTDYPQETEPSGDIGSVRVFLDASAHRRARTKSVLVGALIGGVALLLAWLSARHMARAVIRPLQRISATVSSLHGGKLTARCGPCGKHEIAVLANDVDLMAQRLQDVHSQLEDRVQAATAEALRRLAQAEQATQARTRFLATASHDLRQPVHAMGLFIDSLLPSATAQQEPAMVRLREGTEVMSALLDALLDISRLDANVMSPTFAAVDLNALFSQLDAMHAATAGQAQVSLVWRGRDKVVVSDAALLLRILDNLVRNAVRYGAGGRVLIAARYANNGVRLEVRDNGQGIAPIHQSRIFEEFYQVGNPQRDRRNGFGLGLSICARIAVLLGTSLSVRSRLKQGSTFTLTLPMAEPNTAAPQASTNPPANLAVKLNMHCLLIDDDDAILEATTGLLAQWGCQVDQAQTAKQAMQFLNDPKRRYDLVLCDLQLHDSDDGFELIFQARRLQTQSLAVLVSGTTTPAILQQIRSNAIPLLTKPVAPAKLRALLATLKPS